MMMTSLSINCNTPPPDWSSIQEGKGADKPSRSGARRKKEKLIKKEKNKK